MDPRIEKIVKAFEVRGWVCKGPADLADWWFSDILQLSSTWRPVNTNLYLTLLTDPEIRDKKVVWAVGFSTHIPDNRSFNYIDQLSLNDVKKTDLNEFAGRITAAVLL